MSGSFYGCRRKNMNMNPVVHFEMPAGDRKRMADFYTKVFGWKTKMLGPEMGKYVVVHTTETDDKGMIKKPGAINGGFYEKTSDMGDMHPSVVIAVDDINESVKKVQAAGGKVLDGQKPGEPDDIPEVGLYVSFIDTEGNRVGMLQPKSM
jgi:hypothetical protein